MSPETPDDFIGGLIRRAMVPKGFRPRTDEELNRALEALGVIEISDEVTLGIVNKILNDECPPCFVQNTEVSLSCENQHAELPGQLVEMFRSEGDIAPEIAERLKELEREAEVEANEQGEEDDGE